jgi:predicted DsbA family dithiol-disulfide isomerase
MSDLVSVNIDIFSDIICPWCFIGKKRLEAAAAMHGGIVPKINWRAFLLNPDMQPDGMDRKAYLEAKFGASASSFYDRIALVGDEVGIPFAFDKITRTPDSRPAHGLILSAGDKANALVQEMFEAYFINGIDLGDQDYIGEIATRHDLPYPSSEAIMRQIDNDIHEAGRIGLNGVPYFIFESEWAISGAHPPESFSPLFDAVVNHRLVQSQ